MIVQLGTTYRRAAVIKIGLGVCLIMLILALGRVLPLPGVDMTSFWSIRVGNEQLGFWLRSAWPTPETNFTRMLVDGSPLLGTAALMTVIALFVRRFFGRRPE